jgi:hypothetical protein
VATNRWRRNEVAVAIAVISVRFASFTYEDLLNFGAVPGKHRLCRERR